MRVACVQLRAREVWEAESALEEAAEQALAAGKNADLVVLPEATYPAYVLHTAEQFLDPAWFKRGLEAFASVARSTEAWIAVGLVRPVQGKLLNSAALIDPRGQLASVADKSFLWHFDCNWFHPGKPGEVVATPWGGLGTFVCADARMMEIPRRLAVLGARLLLDCTALVLSPSGTNAQIEYMLSARAWENGAFLAVANKWGSEAGIARYAGRSAIFDPSGRRIAEAGPEEPDTIFAEIDVGAAPGPPAPRDPAGYPELALPFGSLGIAKVLSESPPPRPLRLAFLRPRDNAESSRFMEELGADVGILTGTSSNGRILGVTREGFSLDGQPVNSGDVISMKSVRVGLVVGDRGLVPEEVRVLMLRGASVVVWNQQEVSVPETIVQTRADENRVFLVTAAPNGAWSVYGPTGTFLASRSGDSTRGSLVELPLALAWYKEMAPGTDVVRGRATDAFIDLAY